MEQIFQIGEFAVTVRRDHSEKAYTAKRLDFIDEPDATFYLPMQDGTFLQDAGLHLSQLNQGYAAIRNKAFEEIGKTALTGKYWGPKLSANPQLDLVWARVGTGQNTDWELAYNDAVRDAYTLWIAKFRGTEFLSVERRAW